MLHKLFWELLVNILVWIPVVLIDLHNFTKWKMIYMRYMNTNIFKNQYSDAGIVRFFICTYLILVKWLLISLTSSKYFTTIHITKQGNSTTQSTTYSSPHNAEKDTEKELLCHGGPSPQYQISRCSSLHHFHL